MDEDVVGKTFGCFLCERTERYTFTSGHTVTMCYGHCIHCGNALKRPISELRRHPPQHCVKCPKEVRCAPPKVRPGQEFPGLVALAIEGKPKGIATMWRCRCKVCGRECVTEQRHLPDYKSCGCLRDKEQAAGRAFSRTLFRAGTNYPSLKNTRKLNRNSTTGVRGVCAGRKKRFRAYINLRRKHIDLGEYDKLEDAIAARKAGEEKYFAPEIAAFEADGVKVIGPYQPKKPRKKK